MIFQDVDDRVELRFDWLPRPPGRIVCRQTVSVPKTPDVAFTAARRCGHLAVR